MKIISIILIVIGVAGIILACFMYGDIGVAAIIGALSALLSGISFMLVDNKLKALSK